MNQTIHQDAKNIEEMTNQWLTKMKMSLTGFVDKMFMLAYPYEITIFIINSTLGFSQELGQRYLSEVYLQISQLNKQQQNVCSEEMQNLIRQQMNEELNQKVLLDIIDFKDPVSIREQLFLGTQGKVDNNFVKKSLTDIFTKPQHTLQVSQEQIYQLVATGIKADETSNKKQAADTVEDMPQNVIDEANEKEFSQNSKEQSKCKQLEKKKKKQNGYIRRDDKQVQEEQQIFREIQQFLRLKGAQIYNQTKETNNLQQQYVSICKLFYSAQGQLKIFMESLNDIRIAIRSVYNMNTTNIHQKYRQIQQFYKPHLITKVMDIIWEMKDFVNGKSLSNTEKNKMFYLKMDVQQINNKLNLLHIEQLRGLQRQIFALYMQILKRTFKHEQICERHMLKVNYVCANEYLPANKYLCEQCMQEISAKSHLSHEIICKQHCLPLIMGIKQQKPQKTQQNSYQRLYCRTCLNQSESSRQQFLHLSSCHFKRITDICIETECIQDNKFKICPVCPNQHEGHRILPFTRQSLLNFFFTATTDDDISVYQSFYLNIKEKLKLQPVKKAIDKGIMEMWKFVRFVEAFAIHDSQSSEKWINLTMQGEKEDVLLLWAMSELSKMKITCANKKRNFLEVVDHKLKRQLDIFNQKIVDQLHLLKKRVEKLRFLTQQDVIQHQKARYCEVINTQFEGTKIEKPMHVQDIPEQLLGNVVKLKIIKQDENNQLDQIQNNRQDALKKYKIFDELCKANGIARQLRQEMLIQLNRIDFFLSKNEIDEKLIKQNKKFIQLMQQQLNILLQQHQSDFEQSSRNREDQQLLELRKNHILRIKDTTQSNYLLVVIKNLKTPYYQQKKQITNKVENIANQIKEILNKLQRQSKSKQNLPSLIPANTILLSQKLTNVQVLHIRYESVYRKQGPQYQQGRYDYSVNAFSLFKALNCLPSLRQAEILGLIVEHYELFIKCRRAIEANAFTNIVLSQQQSLIAGNWEWLKQCDLSEVTISIAMLLKFILKSQDFYEQADNAKMFLSLFKSVGDILVQLDIKWIKQYVDSDLARVETIMGCLSHLHSFKLLLSNHSSILLPLLENLSKLTSIKTLLINNVYFGGAQQIRILQSNKFNLNQLFRNNTIKYLSISTHFRFPQISGKINSIQYLRVDGVTISFLLQMIDNSSIKVLHITNKAFSNEGSVKLSKFTVLHTLQIENMLPGFPVNLTTLPGFSLKVLRLQNVVIHDIHQAALMNLFPRLENLTELKMVSFDFSGETLLLIPSPYLKQVRIIINQKIKNEDIQAMDCKWPFLTHIQILNCRMINGMIFAKCKFRGIIDLCIDQYLLKEIDSCLDSLTKRGIHLHIQRTKF